VINTAPHYPVAVDLPLGFSCREMKETGAVKRLERMELCEDASNHGGDLKASKSCGPPHGGGWDEI
jgi:hypothetical protein